MAHSRLPPSQPDEGVSHWLDSSIAGCRSLILEVMETIGNGGKTLMSRFYLLTSSLAILSCNVSICTLKGPISHPFPDRYVSSCTPVEQSHSIKDPKNLFMPCTHLKKKSLLTCKNKKKTLSSSQSPGLLTDERHLIFIGSETQLANKA